MTQGIFLRSIKNKFIEDFITDIANTSTSYFITFGKNDPWPDDLIPPEADTSVTSSTYDVYKNIIYGKQVNSSDVNYVIKNIPWTNGTVYDYYDDKDSDLLNKNFYVVNFSNRVYKCLFNNYGAPSTVEPTDFNPNGDFVTLPDNYKWKYMYTISAADAAKFKSTDYIPVNTDPTVQQYAANGALHVIKITNAGANYPYANGQVLTRVTPFLIKVNPSGIDNISGIYQDSAFYVYSGSGNNFITNITDYTVNVLGNFITTSDITPVLDATSYYKIGPSVVITGDGTDAKAFAYVEPIANSIFNVDVISTGTGYTYATIGFNANTVALGSGGGATANSIISPQKGHGFDVPSELGCDTASISVEVNPADNFEDWSTFRQISLLYNPIASANSSIFLENTFTQYATFNLGFFSSQFEIGTTISGLNSGATAVVVYSTFTNVYVKNILGTFQLNEAIIEPVFSVSNIIAAINTNDLIPYSGDIFYYKNVEPISRYSGSKEQIKIYFKI